MSIPKESAFYGWDRKLRCRRWKEILTRPEINQLRKNGTAEEQLVVQVNSACRDYCQFGCSTRDVRNAVKSSIKGGREQA